MVELHEEQSLILHGGEEVVVPYQVEHVRPPQAEEVRERFAGLAVRGEPARGKRRSANVNGFGEEPGIMGGVNKGRVLQFREAFHQQSRIRRSGRACRRRWQSFQLALYGNDDCGNIVNAARPALDGVQQGLMQP